MRYEHPSLRCRIMTAFGAVVFYNLSFGPTAIAAGCQPVEVAPGVMRPPVSCTQKAPKAPEVPRPAKPSNGHYKWGDVDLQVHGSVSATYGATRVISH